MVHYKNSLYIYGGVVNQSFITNELWRFDLLSLEWALESAQNWSVVALPASVAGHTAHVIKDEMFVIFGYNPFEGYIPRIQIYSFGESLNSDYLIRLTISVTKKWANPEERGGIDPQVMGRFGQASVLTYQDEKKPFIFVYGGFNAPLNSYSYAITDDLLMYDVFSDSW